MSAFLSFCPKAGRLLPTRVGYQTERRLRPLSESHLWLAGDRIGREADSLPPTPLCRPPPIPTLQRLRGEWQLRRREVAEPGRR
jgi:hypothetical protein